jgi:hypothetical protein
MAALAGLLAAQALLLQLGEPPVLGVGHTARLPSRLVLCPPALLGPLFLGMCSSYSRLHRAQEPVRPTKPQPVCYVRLVLVDMTNLALQDLILLVDQQAQEQDHILAVLQSLHGFL